MSNSIKSNNELTLSEITPDQHLCGIGSCPAVFRTNRGTMVIIGKFVSDDIKSEMLAGRVGADETVIEIPAGLIDDLKR